MLNITTIIVLAILLRIGFFLFGLYQDEYMPVKYTDIDYMVFTDASKYVYNGESPYLRETYRYTPILAWMILPINWGGSWFHFGKILFMLGDLVTGVIIIKLLQKSKISKNKVLILSSIWLLNPMVITISTRGSSESILTVMIMLSLNYLAEERFNLAGFWLGLAIHFKIYPIIYLPSVALYLTKYQPTINKPVLKLITYKNLQFILVTLLTFASLNGIMYYIYGYEFIEHSYLYHITRIDHRHNFSVYNILLYYKSALPTSTNLDIEKLAFLPQLIISAIIIPLLLAKKDLLSCLFIQTFAFVTFNKVITSQYFIWFLIFLPHFISRSKLSWYNGLFILGLWVMTQGIWLYNAYQLEFLGINTFDYNLLYSSIVFFLSNYSIDKFYVMLQNFDPFGSTFVWEFISETSRYQFHFYNQIELIKTKHNELTTIMSRLELYSPEGLRVDGRRWNEIRRFECRINTHPNSSDGSSYIEQGNTKVICTVQGPQEPTTRSQRNEDRATIEVNLTIANFATFERKKRSKSERRLIELKTTLERTFEQSILLHLYPRTTIIINVQVLSQDGGMLAAITNSITLALVDAGISMYDYVSSINCGLYDQSPILDLNNLEENDMSSLTIGVIGKSEKLALLLLEDKMPLDNLEKVLSIGIAGAHRIKDLMDMEVRKHGNLRASKLVK
ncbi:GPI14 [Candida jiufengensis]|uniref:GPI14 n=1 Tax=Candida jiufengensis TaxID=497108 RepID=UPI0022249DA4|nr:GPI14 [Candida jiufengensis]KAI5955094.1 GPI14 [Candida jiufengensis]